MITFFLICFLFSFFAFARIAVPYGWLPNHHDTRYVPFGVYLSSTVFGSILCKLCTIMGSPTRELTS